MQSMLQILDFLGVAVFCVSGALVASRLRLDIVAFLFFGVFTGIGGGTLRDLLLDAPVFWVVDQAYLVVCIVISLLMWFLAGQVERLGSPLRWADAVGVAAYSVMGAAKTLSLADAPVVAVMMGVATATFGGIIRDTVAGQPNALVKPEIYLTSAFAGAGVYVTLAEFGVPAWPAAIAGGCAALLLRGGAIQWGWSLPAYRPPSDRADRKP
ncbi:trimeric intracellular cation channel family protein [Stappia taiwanensis]|uniref:Trimeric intracellular cation channel family protein n=1 Tax=Stappia taiwanensis TaxID=992267 RepID=A0A838XWP8_9HYPH|nr:trimeric intracellular cation channel family protein [Stappia taiwanensis]MBA4613451.1 trimeric intracellular cation channel family protein [Stappia taiwanensis]GGF02427.1 membrane protein [Stappia taiwanensis]